MNTIARSGLLLALILTGCQMDHLGRTAQVRYFQPSVRTYFDTGDDDPNELDIFRDGSLTASVDFFEYYRPIPFWDFIGQEDWSWGPIIGVGLTAPAADSSDDSQQASGAPVALVSYGLRFEFPNVDATERSSAESLLSSKSVGDVVNESTSLGLEVGYATGFSTDESLSDTDDTAFFVGLAFNF